VLINLIEGDLELSELVGLEAIPGNLCPAVDVGIVAEGVRKTLPELQCNQSSIL
jgi:hypothetical protein